jgi:hypothetical protein
VEPRYQSIDWTRWSSTKTKLGVEESNYDSGPVHQYLEGSYVHDLVVSKALIFPHIVLFLAVVYGKSLNVCVSLVQDHFGCKSAPFDYRSNSPITN